MHTPCLDLLTHRVYSKSKIVAPHIFVSPPPLSFANNLANTRTYFSLRSSFPRCFADARTSSFCDRPYPCLTRTSNLTTHNGTPLSIANHTPWDAICLSPTTFWQTRSQEMFEKIVEYVVVPDSGYDDVVIFGLSRAVIVEYSRRTTFVRFHPLTVTGRPTRYWLFDARVCACNTIASLCGLSVAFDHVQVCGWRAQCDQR